MTTTVNITLRLKLFIKANNESIYLGKYWCLLT